LELTRKELLSDMPDAVNGKTLDEWDAYVNRKGWEMACYQPGQKHPLPCAHLHEIISGPLPLDSSSPGRRHPRPQLVMPALPTEIAEAFFLQYRIDCHIQETF
jgi:hypothetical protein